MGDVFKTPAATLYPILPQAHLVGRYNFIWSKSLFL